MNFKRYVSRVAFSLFCMSLFTVQIYAIQVPIKQELDKACSGCNKFGKQVKNLPCEHLLCAQCYDAEIEENYQYNLTTYCPSCNRVITPGVPLDLD